MSVVNFRMQSNIGKGWEQVSFSGNTMKLLDFKKAIVDKKKMSGSLDFDLKVVDENGKGLDYKIN